MCGITGFFSTSETIDLGSYYRAHKLLAHRGPDDEGFISLVNEELVFAKGDDSIEHFSSLPHIKELPATRLVLGNRRLKILDLTWLGHQPFISKDGRYVVVFNGEIFNYLELQKELETLGHTFTSSCDTEVLLAAYTQWGRSAFERLNGMWAAAFYDKKENSLLLSRDRFGIKPLFYTFLNDRLIFASEAKAILDITQKYEVNEERAIDYLVFCATDHGVDSMFKGVNQVQPGHFLEVSKKSCKESKWWTFTPKRRDNYSYQDAQSDFIDLMGSSIDLRLRSDVPLGVALSGGLDSTTIACEMANRLPSAKVARHAFSAVYEEEAFSERKYVEDTITQTGFQPHWILTKPKDIAPVLQKLLYYQELPIRSISIAVQWLVMEEVKLRSPTVVLLEGQGGDEVFGGYTNHLLTYITQLVCEFRLLRALSEARSLHSGGSVTSGQILRALVNLPIRAALNIKERLINRSYLKGQVLEPSLNAVSSDHFVNLLFTNLTYRALPEYLRYSDRNSMAFSLESRLPFLDYRLVEWSFSLANEYKVRNGVGKMVVRDSVSNLIPQSVYGRKDKMGFVTPQTLWQRNEMKDLVTSQLTEKELGDRFPFVIAKEAMKATQSYFAGASSDFTVPWRFFCLVLWHKLWIENKGSLK